MKIFFDTEFIDDANGLHLLSIGLVREDGATYYAEVWDVDHSLCNDWVRVHVLSQFTGPSKNKSQIALELHQFCGVDKPEFWAYFHAFDWVLLCRLFGGMLSIPKNWPHYCNDLLLFKDIKPWPQQKTPEHHALNDALWVKDVYESLCSYGKTINDCKLRFVDKSMTAFKTL